MCASCKMSVPKNLQYFLPAEPAERNTHGTDYYQIIAASQEAFETDDGKDQGRQIENTLPDHTAYR